MRFLCLHGTGTNSKIFEMQTAAIRYELGNHHEYDFVEGTVLSELDSEIGALIAIEGDTYSYFDSSFESKLKAINDLTSLLELEGPYDGVIAFSAAGTLVTTWMLDRIKKGQSLHFKCAVFLSASTIPHSVENSEMVPVSLQEVAEIITIPTAHVWGSKDHWDGAEKVATICKADQRSVLVHGGGHEVPDFKSKEALIGTVNMINRAIQRAEALEASA